MHYNIYTNKGLSDEAKEYVIDQTLYLGVISASDFYADKLYQSERSGEVQDYLNSSCNKSGYCNDTVTRTTRWVGKVGLLYPSDFGYASDFSDTNCQGKMSTNTYNSGCTANWMTGESWTISPDFDKATDEILISDGSVRGPFAKNGYGGWPTLLLDASVLAESGNGSKQTPYVLTS